jgi:PAS domain S-box-containing protein
MSAHVISRISTVKPFLSVVIAMIAAALLMTLDHFTLNVGSQVTTMLWAVLIVTILVTMLQIAHTEKAFSKQLIQLVVQKERLANEIKYRLWAEKTSSENKTKLQIVDENFPVMLAYFNAEQQCRYHNRAFRQWFGLKSAQIDNRPLHEFFSKPFYAGVKHAIERVLTGETIQNQHIQQLANRSTCLITGQLVPHFDANGRVVGFYTLYTPRLLRDGERLPESEEIQPAAESNQIQEKSIQNTSSSHAAYHLTQAHIDSSERIIQAIEQGAFHLYCQKIVSVKSCRDAGVHYEILIRMAEEESSLIPPGAFLPLVEKHGLMSRLDRWVVDQAIKWLMEHVIGREISFCINVAGDTLRDKAFADFIQKRLATSQVRPQNLCFEIEVSDTIENLPDTIFFAKKMNCLGCRVSLCSFNHDRASFNLLKNIKADFLKIDGSLICNILRDSENLEKVQDINRFAHVLKIKTIGELVETPEVLDKLTEIGIDYAQGFGIGRPHPLRVIE